MEQVDTKIIVLPAPKFCGRAFKVKELSPTDRLDAQSRAAGIMKEIFGGKVDLSDFEQSTKYQALVLRELVKTMLVAVSIERGFKSYEAFVADMNAAPSKVTWRKLDIEVLATPGEYQLETFLPKSIDHEALVGVLNRTNGFSNDEMDAIVGKALPVSEG